jgi:hypothetical protein
MESALRRTYMVRTWMVRLTDSAKAASVKKPDPTIDHDTRTGAR